MKLKPRYDAPGYLQFDGAFVDPAVPLLRQRRRLAATLGELDDAQWASPTRCEGWSVQDVVAHLVTTNQFWAFSINAGRQGEPTRFLTDFDPVASPAALVDADRGQSSAQVLEHFLETNERVADAVDGLDEDGWEMPAEAPPGHIPMRGVAMHALWDAWIHERDIVLPLGLTPVEEDDEIAESLRYAAVLSPAFAVAYGSTQRGAVVVDVTDPDLRVVVEVAEGIRVRDGDAPEGALHLTGSAVELLEGISYRAPLPQPVPDEHQWLFGGLAQVFDREP